MLTLIEIVADGILGLASVACGLVACLFGGGKKIDWNARAARRR